MPRGWDLCDGYKASLMPGSSGNCTRRFHQGGKADDRDTHLLNYYEAAMPVQHASLLSSPLCSS